MPCGKTDFAYLKIPDACLYACVRDGKFKKKY